MREPLKTVGELREAIRLCEDDEPLSVFLDEGEGREGRQIYLTHASSTAGGRATMLTAISKD